MELSRRTFSGALLGGAVSCIGGMALWSASGANLPVKPTTFRFDAYRGKGKIGVHTVSIVPDGAGLTVTTHIAMDVSLAFIKLFEFKHDAVERWKDGRLVSIESSTNDDGDKIKVSGAATPQGFRVVGPSGPAIAPAETLTSNSLWNPAFVNQHVAINVQHGGVIGMSVHPLGSDSVKATGGMRVAAKYQLITPYLDGLLWYDDAGQWVKALYEKG
jgi:Family of unknown function (DUF6134)